MGELLTETRTDFLYANPSFLEGIARISDFENLLNQYNYSPSAQIADTIAILMDWAVVGNDLQIALGTFKDN